ncbi:uncharacterized protein LOC119675214, partial [Teleopsis dalmanni]|uniref:uncharacterized protein LOC119675214 n=1 Tax=Teleopsis dalmanni TaxID=139649 RepID=UPI0018CD0C79
MKTRNDYVNAESTLANFRIDNTDHIIDVNKGNLAFEFDQVHIICPVYEPGTYENETEKYIIYNVSKVEYETCRITNADPRVIAICDKPQKLMFFTITFRPFTPQPGGLEFLPGNDYYFISTSSKDDLYRRIGGRCSTNNMKVVFKVCCASEENNKTSTSFNHNPGLGGFNHSDHGNTLAGKIDVDLNSPTHINQPNVNNINNVHAGVGNIGNIPFKTISGPTATAINTNIDHFNRIPMQPNGVNVISNNNGVGSLGNSGILLSPNHGTINMIPSSGNGVIPYQGQIGQTGIRINNIPPNHHPSIKNSNNNN